ncbi:MAG: methyltransferase [Tissierellia bacterium]|nr:methyltransferase [Tissierellia bacterium]
MIRKDFIPGTEYAIYQDDEKFSFGIDAILLSDFARLRKDSSLIDLCTGGGIVALRCHGIYGLSRVWGIEIQEDVAQLAQRSVRENGLEEIITLLHGDLREKWDLPQVDSITVNPPYFERGRGIINSTENDRISRYEVEMELEDIFLFARRHLRERGKLFIVHRPGRLPDLVAFGRQYGLEPKRMRFVESKENTQPILLLLECVRAGGKNFIVEPALTIYRDGKYTREIEEIYYGK